MQRALGLQALNWLLQLEQRLKRDGSAAIKSNGKLAAQVIAWCIEQQLLASHSAKLPSVQFTLPLLEQIALTQQQLKQACFRDNPSKQDRLHQAINTHQELKSAGLSPRQSRVLLRLNTARSIADLAVQTLDIDWRQLSLCDYDALLIVENLDCFYQLERFELQLAYRQPLIIYRGDSHYSSGAKALSEAWQCTKKPSLYFGDADLAGLSIALSLNCRSMLLPTPELFQHLATAAMLADQQLKYQPRLLQLQLSPAFLPYQQLICQQLKGLRQQNMQGMLLTPVALGSSNFCF